MTSSTWQLQTPIDTFVFDCDGTLSSLEGIDELARENGSGEEVKKLTARAMGETGISADLYQRRLDLVLPKRNQVEALGVKYFARRTQDIAEIILLLRRLKKTIYIVSAGLYPAVLEFGKLLGVLPENIFAVDIRFDDAGNFVNYDHQSPLIKNTGKRVIVSKIEQKHAKIIYVGDGLNDFAVYDLAARFIGYGGAYYHEKIAAGCQYYIKTKSLAPILPMTLTPAEVESLTDSEKALFQRGLDALYTDQVKCLGV